MQEIQEQLLNGFPTETPTVAPIQPVGYLNGFAILKKAQEDLKALEAEMANYYGGKKSREVERVREAMTQPLDRIVLSLEQSRDKEVVPASERKAFERRQIQEVLNAPELKDILAFGEGINTLTTEIDQHAQLAEQQLAKITPPKAEKAKAKAGGAGAKTRSLKEAEAADTTTWTPPKNAEQLEKSAKDNKAAAAAKKGKLGNLIEQLKAKAESIKGFFVRVIKSNLWEKFITSVKGWAAIANQFADIIQEAHAQATAVLAPILEPTATPAITANPEAPVTSNTPAIPPTE